MRSYRNLSDHDFEMLVADLLGAVEKRTYEVFARGADGGVDLRFSDDSTLEVVQCKHMEGSTYAQILSSARKEAVKVAALEPEPSVYRFVTSHGLTSANVKELSGLFYPWIADHDGVIGAERLEDLLGKHPRVEQRHIKLWLTGRAQLDRAVHASTWTRSEQMLSEILEALPRFVDTGAFATASTHLREEKVLVISGPPGIGKTSVARMLLAEAVTEGYEPIEISEDIDEAYSVYDESSKQIFIYDDFLGATFLQDRLGKNEDKRLASFMRRCRRSKNTLFILTTREHILQMASAWYDELERAQLPLKKLILKMESYSRKERALILYNHLYHDPNISTQAKSKLVEHEGYFEIIDHANYNPRVIEHVVGSYEAEESEISLLDFALRNLKNPERVWEHAFTQQLDRTSKDIVLFLSTLPIAVTMPQMESASGALASSRPQDEPVRSLKSSLKILDDSFLKISRRLNNSLVVSIANPSVADFAASWLRDNPDQSRRLIDSAVFFEQADWISAQVVAHNAALEPALARMLMRTMQSPPLVAAALPFGVKWDDTSLLIERRLLTCARALPNLVGAEDEHFGAWWHGSFDSVVARWAKGTTHSLPSALSLAAIAHANKIAHQTAPSAITGIALAASSVQDWDAVIEFLDDAPHIFDVDENEFADAFEAYADDLFSFSMDEVGDIDEYYELERIAERLGISPTGGMWDEARDSIEGRPEQDWEGPYSGSRSVARSEASDGELRQLFSRFTGGH